MRFVNRNNAREVALALFLLPIAGTKEKAKQKENAVEGEFRRLRAATKATRLGCAPPFEKGGRKLSKQAWGDRPPHLFANIRSG